MKDRLVYLLKELNLTATKFADIIGVQRSSISHVLSGRNKPGYEFLRSTLLKFPDINPEWLLLGKGEMYKNKNSNQNTLNKDLLADKIMQKSIFESNIESLKTASPISQNSNENITNEKKIHEVTNVNSKEVEKIVVFYTDNTFSQYMPQ